MRTLNIKTQKEFIINFLNTKEWFSIFIDYSYNTIDIYGDEKGLINSERLKLMNENSNLYQYIELNQDEINELIKIDKFNITLLIE
jgi:hypothetical protein